MKLLCKNCGEEIDTDYEGITCECGAELCMDCQEEFCPICGIPLEEKGEYIGAETCHYGEAHRKRECDCDFGGQSSGFRS